MPVLLQINTTLNFGSTGHIAEQIAIIAKKNGWDCYIAHGSRYINQSEIKSIKIGSLFGNYFHAFLGEFLGIHGYGSSLATCIFLRKIDKLKPDIIHLHNIHGYYLNIKLLFKYISKKNIPLIWTLHDCWGLTGHCTHFEFSGCDKWKTECHDCTLLTAQYKSRLFDRSKSNYVKKSELYSHLDKMLITTVSKWMASIVGQSILQKFPVKVIYNGVDLDVFKPTENSIRKNLGIPDNRKIILGVVASGFMKEKGRAEFIQLSSDNRYSVLLVGLSEKDQKGLPKSIICIGRTNNQHELAEYYSAADVFVNPTYNEALGLTNIEALACGTPVVTYRTGGSPETIDQLTGVVVERGDFNNLKIAIDAVLKNGKENYSIACRNRAEKLFNKNDRYNDYLALYQEILINQK